MEERTFQLEPSDELGIKVYERRNPVLLRISQRVIMPDGCRGFAVQIAPWGTSDIFVISEEMIGKGGLFRGKDGNTFWELPNASEYWDFTIQARREIAEGRIKRIFRQFNPKRIFGKIFRV